MLRKRLAAALLCALALFASHAFAQTPAVPLGPSGSPASTGGGSGTMTSANIIAGTNLTETGTCNSTTAISCTLNAAAGTSYTFSTGLTNTSSTITLGDAALSYSAGAMALGTSGSAAGSLTIYNATSGFGELFSDAANELSQRNSTNAQAFRVYNTYTSSSTGEWLEANWSGNVMFLRTNANGSGTIRGMTFGTQNSSLLTITGGSITFTAGGVSTSLGSATLSLASAQTYSINSDTILSRKAAANWQLGAADAAAPVAQVLSTQSVVAGTSNTAGVNRTEIGSLSTGTGTSGDIIFQTGGTGAGAAVQNSAVTALTIKGATQVVQINQIASDATHTDATVCEDTTTHGLYAGSGTAGICLGTSSARYKHDITNLDAGLPQIIALQPRRYFLDPGHGDTEKPYYGFLAEDGADVLPELTGYDEDGRPNTFDYLGIVPVLVRAVQQQQAEIEALRRAIR